MTVIYSNERVDGLEGSYCNPLYFTAPLANAKTVYSEDEAMKKAYEEVGVEVLPFKPKKTAKKKAK